MVGEYGALCLERNRGGTEVIGNRSLSVQNIPMIDKCKLAALMQPRHATKMVTDSYNVHTLLLLIDCCYIHYYTNDLYESFKRNHESISLQKMLASSHTRTADSLCITVIVHTMLTVCSFFVLSSCCST